MRYLFGFLCVCALGVMPSVGCSETTGAGGSGGDGGIGGGMGDTFPCTEQGLRDAIAKGGGPHTFSCNGPVMTRAALVIDNDVILDGEDGLTIDGQDDHRVFLVTQGVAAELRRMTVTKGLAGVLGGGGILNQGDLTLTAATVSGNRGGGIINEGTLSMADSSVSFNTASSPSHTSGGLSNTGTATLMSSTVSNNGARFGAGGIANTGTLVATNSIVSENTAESNGGGVVNGGMLTLTNTTVSDNTAESSEGGGIANGAALTLVNSTVSGNAAAIGGGITNNGEPHTTSVVMTNSTVSGNTATLEGGGIYNELASALLINCTLSGNTAANGSAIFSRYPESSVTLERTVVDGGCVFETADLASRGHNIESPSDTCGFAEQSDQPNISTEALKLGLLRKNGGTTETHALAHDSVGIDMVEAEACVDADREPLMTDQRGVERPQAEACDIGAFELEDCVDAADCDDFDDCTDNACTPGGLCDYPVVPDGTSCDDAGTPGTCVDGVCMHPFSR